MSPYDLNRPGGVQQQVLEMFRLLLDAGTDVTLVGPGASRHGGLDIGRVVPVRANGSVVPLALGLGITRRLRTALAGIEVLHVHEPLMPAVGLAAIRSGHAMVATFHARPPAWVMNCRRLIPRTWFRAAVITAVSDEAAGLASEFGKVEIIPNGLHCAYYAIAVPRQMERVVFLGRDEPRKGLQVLLEAWPNVRALHPRAELLVIGSSGGLSGTKGIRFAGRVSEEEKRRLLSTAAVMAAPNLGGESFGIAVAEGMAAGCAIVASDLPAFRALTAGTALLVPPNDPAALAAAVSDLLGNKAGLERLAASSRARAGQFDWSLVLPSYLRCYERVAGAAGSLG